ncbi:unnamed protein product [Rodentolepis nana]|uniref:UBA domain-containing protein n=1 Tax=Rodentolepis nana TaxID=102285 RepID=A0A0R3TB90_RODNA|nr:unnamed protein product [Rodentolepis nana]
MVPEDFDLNLIDNSVGNTYQKIQCKQDSLRAKSTSGPPGQPTEEKYPSILIPSYDHGNCSFSGSTGQSCNKEYKEFNKAVEEIQNNCEYARDIVEANVRILTYVYHFSFADSVEALIQAKGNRDEAIRLLKRKCARNTGVRIGENISPSGLNANNFGNAKNQPPATSARVGSISSINHILKSLVNKWPSRTTNGGWVGLYFTGKYPSILIPSYDHGNCSFSGSTGQSCNKENKEFNNAVERISANSGYARNTAEVNLRVLTTVMGFSLTDAVEALIQAKGSREEAIRLLKRKCARNTGGVSK